LNLFHISENKQIQIFEPRPVIEESHNLKDEKVVWAINKEKLINYIFPRECPRIIYYKDEKTSIKDLSELFSKPSIARVVIVESGWIEKMISSTIYKYVFDSKHFELFDSIAGYYISRKPIKPIDRVEINNLLSELLKENIELKIMDSIIDLVDRVKTSTVQYSMIRMRNANISTSQNCV